MNHKKIYIPTINGYFGGTIALSALCSTLRKLGYDARIILVPYFPLTNISEKKYKIDTLIYNIKFLIKNFFKRFLLPFLPNAKFVKTFKSKAKITKIEGIKLQLHPFVPKDSIVIYSELIFGNPLQIKNVARWFLYHYKYKEIKGAYSESDLFIAFRSIFNDTTLNPRNYIVTINYFNNSLYKNYNYNERKGNCYIIYKGYNRKDLPKSFDGPVFNDKMSQEDLVDMLNSHKYCFIYDTQTFYKKIAAVCGCIPILVMEEGKNEEDYLGRDENHYGIAYGNTPNQIEYAINTRDLCLSSLDYTKSNQENANRLVDILIQEFGDIKRI